MGKKSNKLKLTKFLTKEQKTKRVIFLAIFLFIFLSLGIFITYSIFENSSSSDIANIDVANLSYTIQNKEIVAHSERVTLTITSNNKIDTKYKLVALSNAKNAIGVYYSKLVGNQTYGTIKAGETKQIIIYINDCSFNNQTNEVFKVVGGYTNNDYSKIEIPSGYVEITTGINETNLSSITSTATGFSIDFKPGTYNYTASTTDGGLTLTAKSLDPNATVKICWTGTTTCNSGTGSATLGNAFMGNTSLSLTITVTKENDSSREYTIVVKSAPYDTTLKSITYPTSTDLSSDPIDFSPSKLTYEKIYTGLNSVGGVFRATATDSVATVKICVNDSTSCSQSTGELVASGNSVNGVLKFTITVSRGSNSTTYIIIYKTKINDDILRIEPAAETSYTGTITAQNYTSDTWTLTYKIPNTSHQYLHLFFYHTMEGYYINSISTSVNTRACYSGSTTSSERYLLDVECKPGTTTTYYIHLCPAGTPLSYTDNFKKIKITCTS